MNLNNLIFLDAICAEKFIQGQEEHGDYPHNMTTDDIIAEAIKECADLRNYADMLEDDARRFVKPTIPKPRLYIAILERICKVYAAAGDIAGDLFKLKEMIEELKTIENKKEEE